MKWLTGKTTCFISGKCDPSKLIILWIICEYPRKKQENNINIYWLCIRCL